MCCFVADSFSRYIAKGKLPHDAQMVARRTEIQLSVGVHKGGLARDGDRYSCMREVLIADMDDGGGEADVLRSNGALEELSMFESLMLVC